MSFTSQKRRSNFDAPRLGKIEVVRGVMRAPKFPLVPLVSAHRARADQANPVRANGEHSGQKPAAAGLPQGNVTNFLPAL